MDNESLTAVIKGNLKRLNELLEKGIDIDAQDANRRTLLHHATSNGQIKIVKCLLQNDADVLLTTDKCNTALHLAVAKCDEDLVHVILENVERKKLRKLLDAKTKANGTAAIHVVAKRNCFKVATTLLDYGANFEIKNVAGEKPIDLVTNQELRDLFQLIEVSFAKAKKDDHTLKGNLNECDSVNFVATLNCRNKDGHTLVQTLLQHGNMQLASEMITARAKESDDEVDLLIDPKRKRQVDKLVEKAQEFRGFWGEQRKTIMKLTSGVRMCNKEEFKVLSTHGGKISCRALEMAHEVLLMYRKIEGKGKSRTASAAMRSLEEVLEILGFDAERLYVVVGEDDSYYQKIPKKYKDNIGWLINLLNCIVEASVIYFLQGIYTGQIFDAVIDGDFAKVQFFLENGASLNSVTRDHKSPLCYAVEKGNEEMIQLLLKFDAQVAFECDTMSPIFLAVDKGLTAKIVKLLLEKIDTEDVAEYVDHRQGFDRTALHVAAKKGRLDLVKILLRYGATYWIFDVESCTPLDLSTNKEVSDFLKLVDECFFDAKEANNELIEKLKKMKTDEFLAVSGARNHDGQTLAVVAGKANAKDMAGAILRMIMEAKRKEK